MFFKDEAAKTAEEARVAAARHKIVEATLTCRACKAAKTRTADPEATCKKHRVDLHLNYVTSPISETYWSS